jgi:hypothetical protein
MYLLDYIAPQPIGNPIAKYAAVQCRAGKYGWR